MNSEHPPTDPRSLPADVKRKLLAARDALAVGDAMEAYHQIYSIAAPHFDKLADEVWTGLESPSPEPAQLCKLCDHLEELHEPFNLQHKFVAKQPPEPRELLCALHQVRECGVCPFCGTQAVVPASSRPDQLLLSQAARLLRDYEGDAHAEDVQDVTRWLAIYDARFPTTKAAEHE